MIELFADVICPFAHVSLCRLATRRETDGRQDVGIVVRAWPLEIVNGEPFEADKIAEEIDVLRDSVAPDLFTGFDPAAYPSSSMPALALTAAGYAADLVVGERIAFELRELLFEQGVDVADPAVLASVADRHGLPREVLGQFGPVHDDLAEGRRRGVVGSPHYFVEGRDVFCPSLDVSKPEGSLRVRFDVEHFDAFCETAFEAR
ncbi:DsbA family oxidoreductase [Rhabdothermincola salaria]|uniref:DsbA family oxidoreductase n=1 Tax=Rhabdothermincola salaria TaxID=2903142 RepID=UPI001E64235D|nr:DsbA family protein [Rhabdothermincola salaria]MCD9625694.1 DsbA family protein [Rhabdothermincola salaria]